MKPTVVTATRVEEELNLLPYSVDAVTRDSLEQELPRTTPEALRGLPSVMLQKSAHGQGSPYLRGFTGFRTLMLVDGVRLNNSTFRDGPNQYWSTVDAFGLDRLEVVRGPGSVMYGSDAIGGTVNAVSLGAEPQGPGFDWNSGLTYRFGSAEQSHVGRAEGGVEATARWGARAGVTAKRFGDLYGGEDVGLQRKTGYDEWDFDAKVQYELSEKSRLVYAHQTVRMDDAWRTHSTIYGIEWEGTTRGSDLKRSFDQARDLDYVRFEAEGLEGWVQEMRLGLSRHYQGEEEDRVRGNGTQQVQGVDVETLGVTAQLASETALGRLVYGLDYYRDWVNSDYRGYDALGNLTGVRVQGPVADDATYDLAGVYIEDRLTFWEERVQFYLGGRYSYAAVNANRIRDPNTGETFGLEEEWDAAVGSGRVLYRVDPERERVVLFGGVSQGFRAPNLSDLTRWDADWGQEVPSPGVGPEYFLSLEAGGRLQWNALTVEAAYFHTLFDDMIVRVPTGESAGEVPVVTKMNSGEGYVHGVEVSGSVQLHRDWLLWANGTWMRGEVETPWVDGSKVTEPVSRLMPMTFNSGLRWSQGERFYAELASTLAEKQDRLAYNDTLDRQRIPPGGTPGYAVFHLRAGWQARPGMRLAAALENLTNADYRVHGSGLNEPGRNLVITAELRF